MGLVAFPKTQTVFHSHRNHPPVHT
jgi:hypothetical protein